jgi:hypothetical protein
MSTRIHDASLSAHVLLGNVVEPSNYCAQIPLQNDPSLSSIAFEY